MLRFTAQFVPPLPDGAGSPLQWGNEQYVRDRFASTFELRIERRFSTWEGDSVEEAWAKLVQAFGPVETMLEYLPPDRAKAFEEGMLEHMGTHVQADGRLRDEREYLLVTGIRR